MNNQELMHYGILGMKWGVRRNRKQSSSSSSSKKKSSRVSDDYAEYQKLKSRKPSSLSNSELKKLNERMNLEQNYRRLNPSTIRKGLGIATVTATTLGTIANLYNNYSQVVNIGKKILKK